METNSYIEPVYLISAVAEILNIHPQTLRQYEREGLIKWKNKTLFSKRY